MKALHISIACVLAMNSASSFGQSPGFSRTLVTKADVANVANEAVVAKVEIKPAATVPRHTHHGDEIGYVLSGAGELLVEDEPVKTLKAGDAFVIPTGKVHSARNNGEVPFTVVSVYVIEKGKPLAEPAK